MFFMFSLVSWILFVVILLLLMLMLLLLTLYWNKHFSFCNSYVYLHFKLFICFIDRSWYIHSQRYPLLSDNQMESTPYHTRDINPSCKGPWELYRTFIVNLCPFRIFRILLYYQIRTCMVFQGILGHSRTYLRHLWGIFRTS